MAKKVKEPSVKEQYKNLDADMKRRVQQHGTESGRRVAKIKGSGPDNPIKVLKRLLSYTFTNKFAAVMLIILIFLSSAAGAVGSFLLTYVITAIANVAVGAPYSELINWIITVACIYVAGVVSTFSYNRLMLFIAQGALKRMRNDMFSNMQRLPLMYFDTHTHGELMSRYTNDVDTLRQMLSQSIPQMISAVVTIVVVLLCMIFMSFTLTLVMLVIMSINVVCIKVIGTESSRQFLKQQVSIGKVNGYVEEMMEGQKVIKVFCHENKARENFKAINEELRISGTRANQLTNMLGPMSNILSYFQYVIVAIVGAVLIMDGSVAALSLYSVASGGNGGLTTEPEDIAMLISFLTLIRSFNQPVQQVTQQFNAIVMGLAGAERIFEIFDTPHEDKGGNITLVYGEGGVEKWSWKKPEEDGSFSYIPLRGDIRFKDVIFGYTQEKIILKDISLYAKPGQKIAFVGATGAGKTTITNLINRFYDIQSGSITYDGLDIKSINKDDLRRSLGIVLQDTHLFTGTVMDNIRYGRLNATDEECISAAKLANADYFISHLPEGYNTMIKGDGANLSQGQRQLLAIARAMVSECPVLILDEATSSIDTRTEKLIEQGMDKLMEGRTVFVIAHRLSTVRNSQAIMVLDHGRIIERGTHDQLIEQKGVYYQLYTGAFELE